MAAKKYIKKNPKKLNPGYRTSNFFREKTFGKPGKGRDINVKFTPGKFKSQHKG